MSVSSEISRLTTLRNTLRTKLTALGLISDSGADLDDCVTAAGTISKKSSSDLTASGAIVTVPSGYYATQATKSVSTTTHPSPTASIASDTGVVTASHTQTAGYVDSGTTTGTLQLTTKSSQTYTPGTTNQTIASGRWLTGTQTIKGDENLVAENIAKGVTIFGVTGTHEGGGGVTVEPLSVTENGTYPAPTGKAYSPVTVNVSGGGGGGASKNDVNFYDYDGTIVKSYSASDFSNLTALPDNPSHTGLTAQGWNYTLANAKTYVASYGKLDVWQMYITDDGKTRIYIRLEDGRLAPYLGIAINGTATVDWGDGSTDTVTGSDTTTVVNTQHTYSAAGDYVIAIAVSGSMALVGNSNYGSQVLWKNSTTGNLNRTYQNAIQKVEIGTNTSISTYAFYSCYSLASVTIPSGVTSIGTYAFYNCYSLASVTIPSSVTSIGTYAFYTCHSLASVTIPSSVTSIGTYAFSSCHSLASITLPSSVTSISNNAFQYCYSLASVTIPSGVTSIGNNAFYTCHPLASVTIPSSVTSISTYAFASCYGLGFIKFTRTTPPTVSNSNAWNNIPTDCKIYVPRASLNTYKSATNYPSSSTYTYVGY